MKNVPAHLIAGQTSDGRKVFHTLRWCNRIPREFWFTLDPKGIRGESTGNMDTHFDVRDLPTEFSPSDNYKGRDPSTYKLLEEPAKWAIKALEAGIDPLACSKAAMSQGGAA